MSVDVNSDLENDARKSALSNIFFGFDHHRLPQYRKRPKGVKTKITVNGTGYQLQYQPLTKSNGKFIFGKDELHVWGWGYHRIPVAFEDFIPKGYDVNMIPGRFSSREEVEGFLSRTFEWSNKQIDQVKINKYGAMIISHDKNKLIA